LGVEGTPCSGEFTEHVTFIIILQILARQHCLLDRRLVEGSMPSSCATDHGFEFEQQIRRRSRPGRGVE